MPGVSVEIKGSQSVSKAANEARDSIHNLKSKCQEAIQPLKDLAKTFTTIARLGGAALIVNKFYNELVSCESAFEKLHPEITRTAGSATHWKNTMEESRATVGMLISRALSPMREKLTGILDGFNDSAAAALQFGKNTQLGTDQALNALETYYEKRAKMIADPRFQGIVSGLPPVTPLGQLTISSFPNLANVLGGPAFGGAPSTPFQPIDMYPIYQQMIRDWEHALEKQIKIDKATIIAEELTTGFPMGNVDFTQPGFNLNWTSMAPSGRPEETMAPGSLGPDTQSFDMLGDAFGGLTTATGLLSAIITTMGEHVSSVNRLLNIVDETFGTMFDILEPAINDCLNPLIDILKVVFYIIGQFLLPVYQLLAPVIQLVCDGFMWLYNNIIVPVGNLILNVIWIVVDFVTWIVDTIAAWFNGQAGPLFENSVIWGSHPGLQPMGYEPGTGWTPQGGWPGSTTAGTTGTTYTSVTTVQQPPDIYITMNIYGPVLGEGGKATLGAEVVDAIAAYLGTGAHVAFLNN